jgi:drug/metabolite transporter (DMT)-like permease
VRQRPILLGSLTVVLAASGFGILGPLARFSYEAGLDPPSFVAWRATFGLLVILAVVAVRLRRGSVSFVNPLGLPAIDRAALVLVGIAGLGLNVAMFFAFDLTTIAIALLAFYTYPAFVAIVGAALGHEPLDAPRIAALGLALGGMVLVVAGGLGSGSTAVTVHPLGVLLGLVAAGWQTVFVTVSRRRYATVPPEQATAYLLAIAAVGAAVLAIATGGALPLPLTSPDALGLAAIGGVVASGIPSLLFLMGIRAIGGTRAGILMLFEPLVGVTLAAALLHEALAPIQVVGGVAILAAALLLQRAAPSGSTERIEPAAVPSVEHG